MSLVLDYPNQCQVWVLSCAVDFKSDTSWLLQRALCQHCPSIFWKSKVLWLGWCPHFSAEYVPTPKRLDIGVQALWRYQRHFSMFSDLCGYCPWQWGPILSLQKAILCHSISLVYLGISMEPCWPATQLNVTQSHHWKPHLATRDGQLRFHIPHD